MSSQAIKAAIVAAFMAPASMPALAQQAETETISARDFVSQAASSDQFEIRSSKLAQDKTQSEDIREFAQTMVDDHTATTEELKSLVQETDLSVEQEPSLSSEQEDMMSQLESAADQEFDQLYSRFQVQAHEQAVKLYESFSESGGENQQLVDFASNTLPKLRDHLQMAEDLSASRESQMGAATPEGQQTGDEQDAGEQQAAVSGDQLIGQELQGPDGSSFGEIEDVVLRDDQVEALVVDIGGFLGIGEKRVAIPMDRVSVQGDTVTSDLTEEEAEQLPEFQEEGEQQGQQN